MTLPDCLVCEGKGFAIDSAGREEVCACRGIKPRPQTEPQASSDWLRPFIAWTEEKRAEAEEHARTCTDRPCERCERFVCLCGAPVDGSRRCGPCAEREELDERMAPTRASVPPRFRPMLDADPWTLAQRVRAGMELIRRGLENPPSAWLLFLGPTAAGKTTLAVGMLGAWVRNEPRPQGRLSRYRRKGALFVEAGWLARARARNRLGEEPPAVIDALRAPLLVLDDLGNEHDDRDGVLTDIVYGRHNAELPTWVTCGIAPTIEAFADLLSRRYDGGFVRRIVETGKRVHLGTKPPER